MHETRGSLSPGFWLKLPPQKVHHGNVLVVSMTISEWQNCSINHLRNPKVTNLFKNYTYVYNDGLVLIFLYVY